MSNAQASRKAVSARPAGYQSVIPYLVVPDAQREIDFAVASFGAVLKECTRGADGAIRHAEIRIGDSVVMLGQPSAEWPARPASLYVYLEDVDAVYRRALAAGGRSEREPTDQFYGDRSAGIESPNGISWWIATHVEDVSPEEIARRAEEAAKKA